MLRQTRSSNGIVLAVLLAAALLRPGPARAEEWPHHIDAAPWTVTVYQPQVESFKDDKLTARAAVAVAKKGAAAPVFGAVWIDGRVATDYDTRMVDLIDIKVTTVKFADATEAQKQQLRQLIESEIPGRGISMSLDRLLASLELVEREKSQAEKMSMAPPEILYASRPTVLVLIDGEPKMEKIGTSGFEHVVNTPFFIIHDPTTRLFFLKGAGTWYSAKKATGPFAPAPDPPASVVRLAEQAASRAELDDQSAADAAAREAGGADAGGPPEILVRTKPAELIQTNGEPQVASLEGTDLLYLKNTENDILIDIDAQSYFVLLSGRWFTSRSLASGPWTYVPFEDLPADFANIPANSDLGDVRASVPGTEEAREAVLANQIPQTAVVDRKTASVTVAYGGEPKFKLIEGAKIQYALNSDKTVLLIDNKYYCCDTGIWFAAPAPRGPWQVCDAVPESVRDIPASSPVYNVKYVYVYDSTPDVVYVGYTPAYYGSYIYGPCVIYGTGWYYHPWHGPYYYPRPYTYGFGVRFYPWFGWGFAFGLTNGWFTFGFSWGFPPYWGWWGPVGYRAGYHHGYWHGYNHGYRYGYRAGYVAGRRDAIQHFDNNLYRRPSTGIRSTGVNPATAPALRGSPGATASPPGGRIPMTAARTPNNVYADRDGSVYRKQGNEWQKRQAGGWQADPSVKSQRPDLTNQAASRDRGTARTNTAARTRTAGAGRRR